MWALRGNGHITKDNRSTKMGDHLGSIHSIFFQLASRLAEILGRLGKFVKFYYSAGVSEKFNWFQGWSLGNVTWNEAKEKTNKEMQTKRMNLTSIIRIQPTNKICVLLFCVSAFKFSRNYFTYLLLNATFIQFIYFIMILFHSFMRNRNILIFLLLCQLTFEFFRNLPKSVKIKNPFNQRKSFCLNLFSYIFYCN